MQVQRNFLLALLQSEIVKQAETQISAGLKYDIVSRGLAGNLKKIWPIEILKILEYNPWVELNIYGVYVY